MRQLVAQPRMRPAPCLPARRLSRPYYMPALLCDVSEAPTYLELPEQQEVLGAADQHEAHEGGDDHRQHHHGCDEGVPVRVCVC